MTEPDVSIIIPCYNAQSFLDECIGSAAGQRGVTVEIIAIDDGSTDATWPMLLALAEKNPALKIHKLPQNVGQAKARNFGLDRAQGRYVALLDADDFYTGPDVLARWLAAAERDALEMTAAHYTRLREDGIRLNHRTPLKLPRQGVPLVEAPGLLSIGMSWQFLFLRDFLERHELRFSDRLRQREDRLFFTEALLVADRIGEAEINAIVYREHENSTMQRRDVEQLQQMNVHIELLADAYDRARSAGRVDETVLRANAATYWNQLVVYWGPVVVPGLEAIMSGKDTHEARVTGTHLDLLEAISVGIGPLWRDPYFERPRATAPKYEAVFDVARMAVAARRLDILRAVVQGRRVHHSKLRPLVAEAGFDWGEEAAMRYMVFNRDAPFEEENQASAPPLASLVNRIVLHIGAPKTGSSALQEHFERHRFDFLERGVWYPMAGSRREHGIRRDRNPGHLALMRAILSGEDPQPAVRRLAAEIAALGQPVETLVLSCETILSHLLWPAGETAFMAEGDPFRRIARALGVESLEIAAVLRRPDDWFASYYREIAANPFNHVTAGPLAFFDVLEARGLFDHERLIDRMQTSPAALRAHITSLGAMKAAGGSIPWFLSVLEVDDPAPKTAPPRRSNESFSDAIAANLRLLKLLNLPRPEAEALFATITASAPLAASSFRLIGEDEAEIIAARLAPSLAAYDARFPGEAAAPIPQSAESATPLPVLAELARTEPREIWLGLPEGAPAPDRLAAPLADVRAERDYMTNSASWRITAPLRRGLSALRALRPRRPRP